MDIPFEYGHTVSGSDFINRKEEIKRLNGNFESCINSMIISPRRWGKSSLVKQVAHILRSRKDLVICYIDLFAVRTEEEWLKLFARELVKQTESKWHNWAEAARTFLQQVVPKVAFGSPNAQAELELSWASRKIDPLTIYSLPETIATKKKIKIVICIDEFQNIAYLDDPTGIQKQMRSVWQHHKNACYCLFGSKKYWLTHIFTNHSMPFYRFGDLLYLDKIKEVHWKKFIPEQFEKSGKKITEEMALRITETVKLHPQYVQQLAQKVWIYTDRTVDETTFERGLNELLVDVGVAFLRDVESLTATQLNFLKAFTDGVREFTSSVTLRDYHLGASSNIVRIKTALEQKEILDFFGKEPEFVDPLFELWFKRNFK